MKQQRICERQSCDNMFYTYYEQKCCSQKCAQLIKSDVKLKDWLSGDHKLAKASDGSIVNWARRYLLEGTQYRCSKCCWSEISANGTIPLEIDHIDGDWSNSSYENLRVLCPNCHALTPNYKVYNSGKNKSTRYSHYKDNGWW